MASVVNIVIFPVWVVGQHKTLMVYMDFKESSNNEPGIVLANPERCCINDGFLRMNGGNSPEDMDVHYC